MQYERVKGFFADIKKEDWKVAVGGSNPDGAGYFITPTVIDRPKTDSRIVTEEPFGKFTCFASCIHLELTMRVPLGPIVPVLSFSTEDEAIRQANDTHMGLGASVWSADVERANRVARKIQAGNVWVNTHFELDPRMPFGGHKESGIGTEWGVSGLKSFCNSQTLYLKKAT
jgi:acyl-CoA reductase-like NAD-dependent aldehyde dehydrogenase